MKKSLFIFLVSLCFLASYVFSAGTVDINTASLTQLDELTGIGPVMAQRIIDTRPFSSVDDLLKVKGIGEITLQKIKDQGLAYVSGGTSDVPPTQPVIQLAAPSNDGAHPVTTIYPFGVFINEIMPNPKGPDETDEWIEIYNSNNTDVDLSDWQLQDTIGTITTYTIPKTTKILGNGFLVFKRPETKIMLNNDQDGLNLFSPDGKIVSSLNFTSAPLDQTYSKINNLS